MILGSKLQIPLGSDHIVKNVLFASRCLAKYGAKLKRSTFKDGGFERIAVSQRIGWFSLKTILSQGKKLLGNRGLERK